MKRIMFGVIFVLVIGVFYACDADAVMTVDSFLDDWGVTPGPFGASDWVPNAGIYYTEEDQDTYYLNPGWGGQKYDAEAMYYTKESGKTYIAVVTGHPATGYSWHIPGDIAMDFNGDGVYEYGLKTYGSKAGQFYKDLTALSWSAYSVLEGQGSLVGTTDFSYARTYFDATGLDPLNDHWVIEAGIFDSFFDSDPSAGAKIRWTMSCGNDQIYSVPEPASVALFGLGLAGLLRFRKRKEVK